MYAFERGKIPAQVFRIDIATGKREPWLTVTPRNSSGVSGVNSVTLTRDGRSYSMSYSYMLSELYLASGFRGA